MSFRLTFVFILNLLPLRAEFFTLSLAVIVNCTEE
jgi:hypothetical protein